MYFMEYEYSEDEVMSLIQEAVHDPKNNELRELVIDPIIEVLETPKGRNEYIKYGNAFLEANAEMLAKEYPTKRVSFPRKYVDNIHELFGFTVKSLKDIMKKLLKQVKQDSDFQTILKNTSNVIHAVAIFYADMILHRQLRDSARQQIGLSIYSAVLNRSFPAAPPNESVMTYTYMQLNGKWSIVKSENMVTWIGSMVETAYGFHRTKMSINMSTKVLVDFLNRLRSTFNQSMVGLARLYYDNLDNGNIVGGDVQGTEDFFVSSGYSKIRDGLMLLIKNGDELYYNRDNLYPKIARLKNVKCDTLYELAKKVEHSDIANIINGILYVFLVKEDNSINDINSSKYLGRITNLPTAVDRAINGKPVILPLSKKYKTDQSIVKAYICLIAIYIMCRINDIDK